MFSMQEKAWTITILLFHCRESSQRERSMRRPRCVAQWTPTSIINVMITVTFFSPNVFFIKARSTSKDAVHRTAICLHALGFIRCVYRKVNIRVSLETLEAEHKQDLNPTYVYTHKVNIGGALSVVQPYLYWTWSSRTMSVSPSQISTPPWDNW